MTIIIGIDPHKASHTAVAIDGNEVVLDEFRVRASKSQTRRLLDWADGYEARCWAIESAGGLGYLLAQQLVARGETVLDVPPMLAARVRVLGSGRSQKNDPNDAFSVAIAALRSPKLTVVDLDDHARVMRLLARRHRDMARLRAKHCSRLHALLCDLVAGGVRSEMSVTRANKILDSVNVHDEVTRCRIMIAAELVEDIARLDLVLKASRKRVAQAVETSGTTLCEVRGIGPIGAAQILGYVGDINRFPTKGHFASYNATAPIEASSGGRKRHRLNPRGNRQLNHVMHVAAIVQLRFPGQGPGLLRPQTRRGEELQRRHPGPETTDLGSGLQPVGRRRSPSSHQLGEVGPGRTLRNDS